MNRATTENRYTLCVTGRDGALRPDDVPHGLGYQNCCREQTRACWRQDAKICVWPVERTALVRDRSGSYGGPHDQTRREHLLDRVAPQAVHPFGQELHRGPPQQAWINHGRGDRPSLDVFDTASDQRKVFRAS